MCVCGVVCSTVVCNVYDIVSVCGGGTVGGKCCDEWGNMYALGVVMYIRLCSRLECTVVDGCGEVV